MPFYQRLDYYALVYEGYIKVERDGVYWFYAGMDFFAGYHILTGGAIYIHGKQISADNSGWGRIALKSGLHPIKITVLEDRRQESRVQIYGAGD